MDELRNAKKWLEEAEKRKQNVNTKKQERQKNKDAKVLFVRKEDNETVVGGTFSPPYSPPPLSPSTPPSPTQHAAVGGEPSHAVQTDSPENVETFYPKDKLKAAAKKTDSKESTQLEKERLYKLQSDTGSGQNLHMKPTL